MLFVTVNFALKSFWQLNLIIEQEQVSESEKLFRKLLRMALLTDVIETLNVSEQKGNRYFEFILTCSDSPIPHS